jgi:hypothetical protein
MGLFFCKKKKVVDRLEGTFYKCRRVGVGNEFHNSIKL